MTLVDEHGVQHGRASTRAGRYELVLPTSGVWLLVISAPGHVPSAARLVAELGTSELTHDVALPVGAPPASGSSATPREPQPVAGS
ncbi:MAG TPA: hypothetical protein VGH76_15820 [Actinomycetospora sp.]|uniref:hypothetical protein n=1 Tax=Actinomycetospora sp. TaxID=1872135 RepID=UPI002F3EA496